jgi:hypothetical protein
LQKIVDAEDKNPNEFWKYVDKLKVKVNNDPSSNISPNEWLTYFKHLMNIVVRQPFLNPICSLHMIIFY